MHQDKIDSEYHWPIHKYDDEEKRMMIMAVVITVVLPTSLPRLTRTHE